MMKRNYWPLDYDPEVEIYDNPSWDLPGFRRRRQREKEAGKRPARKR